jgi:murein DD-endopeptidase MepM/ murein hydrolase activator NlpD
MLAIASSAWAGVLEDQLKATKHKKVDTKAKIAKVEHRTAVMTKVVAKYRRDIAKLDAPIAELDRQIAQLESQIDAGGARIEHLKALRKDQAVQIRRLDVEVKVAREHLTDRLVEIYTKGNPNYGAWMLDAGSLRELIDRQEMAGQIAELDRSIMTGIADLQRTVRIKRAHNQELRLEIAREIKRVEQARVGVEEKRSVLAEKRDRVAKVKADRDAYLSKLQNDHAHLEDEYDQLDESSKNIAYAIEHGITPDVAGRVGGLSPSGLIWPVNGPVVSGFKWRWGRMHEGIDIAVPGGTPIGAAAAGVVTYASWMNGYGNFVLIQHAGGLVTGYGHQSRIATSVGAFVMQGQIIGYVGCTGHCFGDHLHFETRTGTTPHDPMGYL